MSETRKTLIFAAAAIAFVLIVLVTGPKQVTPDAFSDLGEEFFPEFTDPNTASTLEVIEFNEETGSARPFKVTFKNGRWTIPSHYDYPADGQDRLAETAAGLIGITKDDFRTDNVSDYASCGVIDPLDESVVELQGRGKRVTIKGENDVVLADIIIGKSYEDQDRPGFYLVRVPGQKRVYGSHMDIDVSTDFGDWIEADLLMVEKDQIEMVMLKDYSINERTRKVEDRGQLMLSLSEEGEWSADNMGDDQQVDTYKMNAFLRALDELTIEGVRPKPEGLTASLKQTSEGISISTGDMLSLQSKGFYFASDGRLLSNEGELQVTTDQGISYTLRFGEIAFGTGVAVTAGADSEGEQRGPGENRYLMITVNFDDTIYPEPPKPDNLDFLAKPDSVWTAEDHGMKSLQIFHDAWESNVRSGRELSNKLNDRFAKWYYVISAENFEKLRLTHTDILKDKPETE